MRARIRLVEERQLKQIFQRLDTRGNGFLTRTNLARFGPLRDLFDQIDADGDGKVTEKELQEYVKKVNALRDTARAASASLSLSEEGNGLFDLLDLNRDGVLSVRELRRAPEILARLGVERLSPADVPRRLRADVELGGGDDAFRFGRVLGNRLPPRRLPARGPEWFRKMDRNGDGDVSRSEWLGTKEEFDRIDTDGDGLISPEEAEAYDRLIGRKGRR
jgi:Ca2+-binding EF-hand superfamily protein